VRHGFDTSLLVAHEVACHARHAGARDARGDIPRRGIASLLTLNAEDFAVFGEFACLGLM